LPRNGPERPDGRPRAADGHARYGGPLRSAPVELDRALPYVILRMVCSENLQGFGIMPRGPKCA